MSATNTSVTSSSGILALCVMFVVTVCGYTFFLEQTGRALDYQAEALSTAWYMLKPAALLRLISEGGLAGTLIAVVLNIAHATFYAALLFTAGTVGLARFFKPRNNGVTAAEPEETPSGLYACDIAGSSMMIMIPGGVDPATGKEIPGIKDANPFTQIFLRCDRKPIQTKRPPSTPVEQLEVALYEILEAHPTVPASVGHHHADTNLREHSMAIASAVVAYIRERGWNEPLARVAGLAHDMDKLLAYQETSPGSWAKRKDATHHNTFSAYLVAQQPEFANLDADDQLVLTLALRYYHHPEKLPRNVPDRVERLIGAIRTADSLVIQSEKVAGIANARESSMTNDLMDAAISRFLANANINDTRGNSSPAGWTKDALEMVVVPMSRLIESLGEFLPGELARQLQLGAETRSFRHPAIPVILESLTRSHLLLTVYKDKESKMGLFDVKVGLKTWKASVLLDKDQISELAPGAASKWGNTEFNIRVQRPTVDRSQDEETNAEG